jgi:hypothetical protein
MVQMRHSSETTTTNNYGHLFESDRRDLLERLNRKITGL